MNLTSLCEQATKEMSPLLQGKEQEALKEVLEKIFVEGETPKDALGFTKETVALFYAHGHQLYQSGKYQDAILVFQLLSAFDPQNSVYPFALGGCHQAIKEYDKAEKLYLLASVLDKKNPIPFFHLADCYEKMDKRTLATLVLKVMFQRCHDIEAFKPIKAKGMMMLQGLERSLQQRPEKLQEGESL